MERSLIQLLHKRGRSQRQIAEELGHSRTTVGRVLAEPVDRQPARRPRRSKVDPYREQIRQWVRAGLSGVRMLELARTVSEPPYQGGRSVFRAVVRHERLAQAQARAIADVPVRFEGLPGEYLQVDWGEVRRFPFTQQASGTRYFLACRLKYSRWTLRLRSGQALGAVHQRDAPGDAAARAGRLLRGAGLGTVGAGLRQHEDRHLGP